MSKKTLSTVEKFVKSLTPKQRKQYEKERKEFLISEMVLAAMEHDHVSVRKLAKMTDVGITEQKPFERLLNKKFIAQAIIECLENDDFDGVLEILTIYSKTVKKAKSLRNPLSS